MSSTAPHAMTPAPVPSAEEDLLLDDANPRFAGDEGAVDQDSLLQTLWRDFAVGEIALSIAANGFFEYEPLLVAEEGGKLVVVEGNRRLAAVKLLRHANLREAVRATDLPSLDQAAIATLGTLPVIVTPRENVWQYVGFKHVNGPQPWQSFAKAEYIAWVHNQIGASLDEIARQIGDQNTTVKRLYRGLMVLGQAEQGGFDKEDRFKQHFSFSHLYTGLDYPGVRKFIGLTEARDFNREPVPRSKVLPLTELCVWMYGSRSRNARPVVQSQNPDLRRLDEVLQSPDGTAALRRGLPLSVSLDVSRGDARLLREALVGAKANLQDARGKLLSGYQGEADLFRTAEEIVELGDSIVSEMEEIRTKRRQAQRRRRASS